MKKTKYYFTFGSDPRYPFQGGWVEVWAVSLNHAIQVFREKYPDWDGELNCENHYTEGYFQRTGMRQEGNHGAYCHEILGAEE